MNKKYPKTFHLPWSPGASKDDRVSVSISNIINVPIIISDKLDGGCTSLQADGCFARTHAHAPTHASFDLLKSFHASVKHKIPVGLQLFGEWLFARHSIAYNALPAYFLLFNVRDLTSTPSRWLSWQEIEMWAEEIDVPTVPILFKGQVSSEKELQDLTESFMSQPSCCGGEREGIVVRLADSFSDDDFSECIGKIVRPNHVNTNMHWAHQEIVRNKLKA